MIIFLAAEKKFEKFSLSLKKILIKKSSKKLKTNEHLPPLCYILSHRILFYFYYNFILIFNIRTLPWKDEITGPRPYRLSDEFRM